MWKWSRQHTLNSGLIVIALLAILSSGASLFASRLLVRDMAALTAGSANAQGEQNALRLTGLREVSNASASLLTGDEQYARASRSNGAELRGRLHRLRTRTLDDESRLFITRAEAAERAHQEAFEAALRAPAGRLAAATAASASRGAALIESLDSLTSHMQPPTISNAAERSAAERTQAFFKVVTAVSILVALLLCAMLIFIINRSYREQTDVRLLAEEGQTRSAEALEEERAASHLKDEFLATVSHELRNPLAPILTWTQLLRSGTLDKEKANRGLEVIERNVISLSELIDDLVDVSRVVAGKFRLDVRPIDLAGVVKTAVESQRPASDAKKIRLQLVLDERAGMVSGDSERLHQVVGNLLSNAIKFTPKGGSVQVTLGRAESHVELAVSDTGIGMEGAFLPHVFEPFQQAMDGSMRRHGGLGLGLSIVRHIVELHGGEIVAESAGRDQGSRFTIKLPLLGTGESTVRGRPRHPSAGDEITNVLLHRLDKIRVLIVDDEPTANEAVQVLLESCGAEVRVAGSTAQALQVFDIWRPDVLLSDIAMPEEDGYELIKKVRGRSSENGGDIPAA
ncbi:MAG TPA: hybrid sensor histidine kinase/response regulator, partial [Candidatus Eisenbacteria bacterium]|nr:hybrid sensor histidine kinase/response regulator [Candidatus Eisenbacteria bacterium]